MLTAGVAGRSRPRPATPVLLVAFAVATAGCAAPVSPTPPELRSVPAPARSSAPVSPEAASTPTAETEQPPPTVPAASIDSANLLRLCWSAPDDPIEIDCRDAADLALSESVLRAPPIRADLIWSPFCPIGTPCPSQGQDVDHAYVVLYLGDGTGLQVPIVHANGGLVAGAPTLLSASDIGPRPTFTSPPARKADVGPAPAVLTGRPALPFCGSEEAGLAGPFNTAARTCFLNSLLAGHPAELASNRSDVEGLPFFELWRFAGAGPVVIAHKDAKGWSKLVCGVNLVADSTMLIDHGDCEISPIG